MAEQETILVVDDESRIVHILEFNLVKQGYRVRTASNGLEALASVEEVKPALIILDMMMPKMDGLETCRRLKNQESTKDIPIFFLTAQGQEIDRDAGSECGANAYITKPFSPRQLMKQIRETLDGLEVKESW